MQEVKEKSKITPKAESDLLINVKEINKWKSSTATNKLEQKAIDIESGLDAYNQKYLTALKAPIPNIGLHYNEVLVRAVPAEIKSKGNLIVSVGDNDFNIGSKLNKMSDTVDQVQEILMVGRLISQAEQDAGIRPGRLCKINLKNFRGITDEHQPGMINSEYIMPIEIIDGHKYMLIDKRDILYTKDK